MLMSEGTHAMPYLWSPEDSTVKLAFSYLYADFRDWTQAFRLVQQAPRVRILESWFL